MITATGLRWLLSLVFALSVLYGLRSATAPGRTGPHRVDHALHTAMGLVMIAMVWPWGMELPTAPQIVLFGAGALWFACSVPLRADSAHRLRACLSALPRVLMTGAMAWMAAAMDGAGMAAGGGGGAMHDMPGMDMSGSSGASAMTLTGAGERGTAVVLAVLLAAFALRRLARAFDRARSAPARGPETVVRDDADVLGLFCHAAMGLGMAVTLVLLV
ncbi:DUF5134 domain-containing protein [Streptomyces sp. AM6-12]|uniref:DUF5134 domain-containing protein n=1 Tax=Streptomyces sp. AM6-12 TaxID=3345149 RepID=UPI00378D3AB9